MKLLVKLHPHIGKVQTQVGDKTVEVDVDLKQCFVNVNHMNVAIYCGAFLGHGKYEPDKYLAFTQPLPEAVQAEIAAEVAKITGGVGKINAPPPEDHDVPEGDD